MAAHVHKLGLRELIGSPIEGDELGEKALQEVRSEFLYVDSVAKAKDHEEMIQAVQEYSAILCKRVPEEQDSDVRERLAAYAACATACDKLERAKRSAELAKANGLDAKRPVRLVA